jgi:hypothetical protein
MQARSSADSSKNSIVEVAAHNDCLSLSRRLAHTSALVSLCEDVGPEVQVILVGQRAKLL